MIRALAAMLVVSALLAVADEARACIWLVPKYQPVYAGGDLMTQIAAKAHTLQLVRVASRTRLKELRTSWGGSRAYSFTLEPIMTLQSRTTLLDRLAGRDFRNSNAQVGAWAVTAADAKPDRPEWQRIPSQRGMLPEGMLDAYPTYHGRKGERPYSLGVPVGQGSCAQVELRLALGDLFIAARRPDGKLYDTSYVAREPEYLELDIRQFDQTVQWQAPSLIRIESLRDPILLRLQRAIAARK